MLSQADLVMITKAVFHQILKGKIMKKKKTMKIESRTLHKIRSSISIKN